MEYYSSKDILKCLWKDCDQFYADPEQLYSHLTNDHVGRKSTGNLCLTCHWENCSVSVIKRDHITSHLRVHIPLKPHCCNFCEKTFKRPQDLKKHERIHNEENSTIHELNCPLTPPKQSDMSISPNNNYSQSTLKIPISPPHSTACSDDNWMQKQQLQLPSLGLRSVSPSSDYYDGFNSSGTTNSSQSIKQEEPYSPQELFHNLMFTTDGQQMKTDYNSDMINNLSMFQSMVDNGSISPNSLQLITETQVNDFNLWLAQLTESMENEHQFEQQPEQQYEQQQYQPSYDTNIDNSNAPMNYADMLLQFNSNNTLPVTNNDLYPITPNNNHEQDLYVRSTPMMMMNQQEYNPPTDNLYGNLNQYSSYQQPQPQPLATTGLRHHYANVPGLDHLNYSMPELRTTQNFGSSKDSIKYKQEQQQFKPTKSKEMDYESKKNLATMVNVFSSVDSVAHQKNKEETEEKQSPPSAAKRTVIDKNILDLLTSDMSDLALDQQQQQKEEQPLYPSSSSNVKDEKAPVITQNKNIIERHQKLLKQLSGWINKSATSTVQV